MRRCLIVGLCVALAGSLAAARTIVVAGADSAAIQAAITASRVGDVVRLPAGAFTVSEAIAPKSGTQLVGAGQDRTVLTFKGDKGCGLVMLNGVEDVTVRDFTLDAANSPLVPVGVSAYDARRLTIQRVTVRNVAQTPGGAHGIHFNGNNPTRQKGVTDSLIEGCSIENIAPEYAWGAGIRLSWGSARNRVLGNRIHNTGRGGILADNGSSDLVIRANTVTASHGERLGIEIWVGCDRCIIEDNRIDHWLSVGGCDWCAVRRNTITCPDCSGFIGLEAIGSYLIFTDNAVDQGQIIGLSVSNTTRKEYHYYRNDSFRRCSQWAVQIQGEGPAARYYYFENCSFSDTATAGGRVIYPGDEGNGLRWSYGSARDMTFENCSMSGNARHGIQITTRGTDRLTFLGCRITDNKGSAIAHAGGFTGLEWHDCTVRGNGSDALPPAVAMPEPPTPGLFVPARGRVGEIVQCRSTAEAGAGEIQKIMWDLGDGLPRVGRSVRHRFSRPGTYPVNQIVWDSNGRAARAEATIKVMP